MTPFKKSTLDHILRPLSRSSSTSSGHAPTDDQSRHSFRSCRSKTASSCELFSILKLLAAGSTNSEPPLDNTSGNSGRSSPSMDDDGSRAKLEEQMRQALSEASTGLNSLNSDFEVVSISPPAPATNSIRPNLSRSVSQEGDRSSFGEINVSPSDTSRPGFDKPGAQAVTHIYDSEEKLEAIVQEFGAMAELMEPPEGHDIPEPEFLLAELKGSLYKGVVLLGNLHLTTHRLLFHARLPPESALFDLKGDSSPVPDVLIAGPVTLHRSGALKSSRRLWMEIGVEMLTTYPSGSDIGRVRPIQTFVLSGIQHIIPFDPENPCVIAFSYRQEDEVTEISFHVDTAQSALQWRRSLEAAIFRHARRRFKRNLAQMNQHSDAEQERMSEEEWPIFRCCLPLDRIQFNGVTHLHDFAQLISLHIDLDGEEIQRRSANAVADDDSGRILEEDSKHSHPTKHTIRLLNRTHSRHRSRESSPSRSASGNVTPSTPTHPSKKDSIYLDSGIPPLLTNSGGCQSTHERKNAAKPYEFSVGVLDEYAWFTETLQAAIAAAGSRRYLPKTVRPPVRLELGDLDCHPRDEDLENIPRDSGSSYGDDQGSSTLTHALFQSEKTALASKVFGLNPEDGIYMKRCYFVNGVLPMRGHIILAGKYICFWRRANVGGDIKYRFPTADVKGAHQVPSLRAGFHGMALKVHGAQDVHFEFWSKNSRKDVMERIAKIAIQASTGYEGLPVPSDSDRQLSLVTKEPSTDEAHPADILAPGKTMSFESHAFPDEALGYLPFIANHPFSSSARLTPRHFVCLTIGSRGDVQPYIALALRLKADQHRVTIVTHSEFREWIESYGIEHRQAGGDPTALMKLSTEHKMFSPGFFKESLGSFRQWLDDLLLDSWHACQDAAVLIESPSTMAGIHIAEALKIPYFRAFTMPWTRTTAYPQAFMVPAFEMGPSYNYSTYVLFDSIIWRATAGQINRWRKRHLHISATDMSTLSVSKVPFLYNFSPAVVPKPLDWNDDISVTGYWHLENSDAEWTPPKSLEDFMVKAKEDGRPLVYIGFGSIVVPNPNEMTKNIIAAVEKADVRAIVAKGWSSRGANVSPEEEVIEFPSKCFGLDKVPHGWLFPKINAALHHGGAGTVGASLRAGVPTLIKPWFGDQFFWATRVTKLGVGLKVGSLRSDDIARALVRATTDQTMIEKAARIGARIRAENGVDNALQAIHHNIVRAAGDRSSMT